MRDYLLDLVEHTYDLGCIDMIKINGTDSETAVDGISDDRTVVIQAAYKNPVAEFIGTFGMPNLNKLKVLLNLEPYREDAEITIQKADRNGESVPVSMHFENKGSDFKNDYRFMAKEIVEDKIKALKFKVPSWDVEFEPTVAGIMRLKMQAQANSDETLFQTRLEDGNLKFIFGDHSTHAGEFVFQTDVAGTLKNGWNWPVAHFMKIMDLTGDKTIQFSNQGACMITVDSGIGVYNYILPAQSK
jgi:hypothetical protein